MKAVTVCQPYAWLICLPADDPEAKRCENRTWPTNHRGPLAIHAGKSRAWMESWEGRLPARSGELVFGAVVAVAELVDCVFGAEAARRKHPTAGAASHFSGPWCWILRGVHPLRQPVRWTGARGLFDLPQSVFDAAT